MDLDYVSVHKLAKKELGQYPAILTSHLVNNPYLLYLSVSTRAVIGQFCGPYFTLLHITREFYSIKLICTNLYALFSHVKKAYTANQNCVQLFHISYFIFHYDSVKAFPCQSLVHLVQIMQIVLCY